MLFAHLKIAFASRADAYLEAAANARDDESTQMIMYTEAVLRLLSHCDTNTLIEIQAILASESKRMGL